MTRRKTVALCFSKRPFVSGDDQWAQRVARDLTERGHQIDFVTVPFVGSSEEALVATVLRWRLVELHRVGRTRVDLALCGDPAAAFVGHPNRIMWLERRDGETGGLAAVLNTGSETTAGKLAIAAIARVSTIVVGSPEDGGCVEHRFGVAPSGVQSAAGFLSSFPSLGMTDGSGADEVPSEAVGSQ